jgi:hypothetical protein
MRAFSYLFIPQGSQLGVEKCGCHTVNPTPSMLAKSLELRRPCVERVVWQAQPGMLLMVPLHQQVAALQTVVHKNTIHGMEYDHSPLNHSHDMLCILILVIVATFVTLCKIKRIKPFLPRYLYSRIVFNKSQLHPVQLSNNCINQ